MKNARRWLGPLLVLSATAGPVVRGAERAITVRDEAALRRELRDAQAGTTLRLAPGSTERDSTCPDCRDGRMHPS